MKTVSDLGKKLKAKHPHKFGHLSDAEAGRLAKQEFPGAYTDYIDEALAIRGTQSIVAEPRITALANSDLERKVAFIWNQHVPGMWNVISWYRRKKMGSQNLTLQTGYTQIQLLFGQVNAITEQVINQIKSEKQLELFIRDHHYKLMEVAKAMELLQQATDAGLTIDNYQEMRLLEYETNIRTAGEKAMAQIHVWREERLAELRKKEKDDEHRRKIDALDKEVDREIKLAQEQLRLEIIARHLTNQQQMSYIQDLIDQEYITIAEIQDNPKLPEGAKQNIINSRMRMVEMLMKQQDEAQARVLQQR